MAWATLQPLFLFDAIPDWPSTGWAPGRGATSDPALGRYVLRAALHLGRLYVSYLLMRLGDGGVSAALRVKEDTPILRGAYRLIRSGIELLRRRIAGGICWVVGPTRVPYKPQL